MRTSLQATAMLHPTFTPVFLLARLGADPSQHLFLALVSRSEDVMLLHQLFSACYQNTPVSCRPVPDLPGIHSLKVALLAMGVNSLFGRFCRTARTSQILHCWNVLPLWSGRCGWPSCIPATSGRGSSRGLPPPSTPLVWRASTHGGH